jgi:hypothetical protein
MLDFRFLILDPSSLRYAGTSPAGGGRRELWMLDFERREGDGEAGRRVLNREGAKGRGGREKEGDWRFGSGCAAACLGVRLS